MYPRHEIILDDEKREAMRQVIAERGSVANIDERYSDYSDYSEIRINYYGWVNYRAGRHLEGCSFTIPKGVTVIEIDFSQFAGTNNDSDQYHGIMAHGEGASEIKCACGELKNLHVMYLGTFSDLLLATLAKLGDGNDENHDPRKGIVL